jgi:hypothetical protein
MTFAKRLLGREVTRIKRATKRQNDVATAPRKTSSKKTSPPTIVAQSGEGEVKQKKTA